MVFDFFHLPHLHLPDWHLLLPGTKAAATGPRIVEYFAASCPHCQQLAPIWSDAEKQWVQAHASDQPVAWEQKECYGDGWSAGTDAAECRSAGVHSFPTIKFFSGPEDTTGKDFLADRSAQGLVDFVQSQLPKVKAADATAAAADASAAAASDTSAAAAASSSSAAAGDAEGARFVEYYASSCPHCKHLAPVWDEAKAQFAFDAGHTANVEWVQKECYGDGWGAGKDQAECEKADVHSFPTIRYFKGPKDTVGETYEGDRTASGMVNFVKSKLAAGGAEAAAATDSASAESGEAASSSVTATAAAATEDAPAVPDVPRFVEYFAGGCPHCKHIAPVWADAAKDWQSAHGESAGLDGKVMWQQKECFDQNWEPGKDHAECEKAGVHAFPTMKFFQDASDKEGELFDGDRTKEALTQYVNEQVTPEDPNAPPTPPQVIEYVAKDCPHCQHAQPVWEEVQQRWDTAAKSWDKAYPFDPSPQVQWTQKECFGKGWKAGADFKECDQAHVHGFPTIRMTGGKLGHRSRDFAGNLKSDEILKFVVRNLPEDQEPEALAGQGPPSGPVETPEAPTPSPTVAAASMGAAASFMMAAAVPAKVASACGSQRSQQPISSVAASRKRGANFF
mmetsp:Transcript_44029/g.94889  ORF Transcript_44029/g.94889 Transcript_44029/m.94889 type:complete len:621 (-) Transcript_44029:331-2193(-)